MSEAIEAEEINESDADYGAFKEEINSLYSEVEDIDPAVNDHDSENVTIDMDTGEVLLGVVSPTFDLLCPNWGVTLEEKKALADAYGSVIDKYFPDLGKDAAPELIALAMTAAIFAPRIGQPRKLEEKKSDKGADSDESAD